MGEIEILCRSPPVSSKEWDMLLGIFKVWKKKYHLSFSAECSYLVFLIMHLGNSLLHHCLFSLILQIHAYAHSLALPPGWYCETWIFSCLSMVGATANVVPQKLLSIEMTNNHHSVLYMSITLIGNEVIDVTVYTKEFFLTSHYISSPVFFLASFVLCSLRSRSASSSGAIS